MARKAKKATTIDVAPFIVETFEFDGEWFGEVVSADGNSRTTRDGYEDEESARFAGYDLAHRMLAARKDD